MGLRYLGNINKPGYNPLASNITTGVNVVQYQGIFTTQQQLQAITTGQWVTDPVFDYSTLLLQADGIANGSQNNTFLDSSTNNFTITRNGNTTQGTFSPFSQTGWGNYFGSVSDYLGFSSISMGSSYTIEFFVFFPSAPSSQNIILSNATASGNNWIGINATDITVSYSGTNRTFAFAAAAGTWYYVQIISNASSLTCYVNGTQRGTAQTGPTSHTLDRIAGYASNAFVGYLSNFRITNAALTAGATPTTPLTTTVSAGTVSLLTCQSNRFIDNSSNAFAITVNGTPSVQAFSPFAPQFQYTASGTGGSGYFDGTGDYLSIVDQAAFYLGTNNFTLEGWFYATGYPNYARLFGQCTEGATGNNSIGFFFDTGGNGATCNMRWGTTTNQTNDSGYITVNAGKNQWHHIAAARDGNTLRMYFDGVQVYSTSVTGATFYNSTADFRIGASSNASPAEFWQGYMAGVRLVNGTCLYPNGTTFTLPTTPPTAITNTQLLLNFTNAGIYDGTMKNNLETVGNAQISTSVVKYGSGSMYFDGSGDYLDALNGQNFVFGTGDFTIEFWLYTTATSFGLVGLTGGTTGYWQLNVVSSTMYWQNTRTLNNLISVSATPVINGAWNHIAVVRFNGVTRIYFNGVQQGSAADTTNYNGAAGMYRIGQDHNGTSLNGYIDDLRTTKGIARYTQNFIPPSVALPRQ